MVATPPPSRSFKSAAPPPPRREPWQFLKPARGVVGVVAPCYGSGHVIFGLPTDRYTHQTVRAAPLRRFDRGGTFFRYTPWVLRSGLRLLHTWNSIPVSGAFVVSHELELPRYLGHVSPSRIEFGLRRLESGQCRAILPLSDYARRFAARRFELAGREHLIGKMQVFRGAVRDPVAPGDEPEGRPQRESFEARPLRAILVGSHLFHKGAMYAVEAFQSLRDRGFDVRLTLVGDFEKESFVFKSHLPSAQAWRERAQACDWLTFMGPIPNHRVFEELRAHDVCLYPSMDESLGWLTIEASLMGIPIIGNRLCAFPELVAHGESGWLIDLPLQADGRWAGIGTDGDALQGHMEEARRAIVAGIEQAIHAIHQQPSLLRRWGIEARARMRRLYDMEAAAAALESIYDRACDGAKLVRS